jgi:hypothetical protein
VDLSPPFFVPFVLFIHFFTFYHLPCNAYTCITDIVEVDCNRTLVFTLISRLDLSLLRGERVREKCLAAIINHRPPSITSSSGLFLEWHFAQCCCNDCRSSLSEFGILLTACYQLDVSSWHLDFEPMYTKAQRQKRREFVLSSLNVAIEASNLAKEFCSITPAKPVFGSLSVILTMIKVSFFLYRLS